MNWPTVRLMDVTNKIGSGATPKGGASVYISDGETALIRSQNVLNGRFSWDGLVYINQVAANKLSSVEVHRGDVLLNITGDSVARACLVVDEVLPARVNQHVAIIRPDHKRLNPKFLHYFLVSKAMQNYMLGLAGSGATRNALTKGMIEEFEVPYPSLSEQDNVAEILSSLDEKIELNRKQNRTLEAIAQALFKRWFVEFEFPDQNGQPYKSSGGAMQPSELGEIPVGWEVVSFAELVELIGGGTPKTSVPEYWDGDIPWFSVVDAPSGSDTFVIDTEKKVTQEGINNSSTKLLRPGTTIVSARGTVGRLALVGRPMAMNQSCYGVQGKSDNSDYFTYLALQRALGELRASAHGSVFDTITRTTFDNLKMVRPDDSVIDEFERLITPLFHKLLSNCEHSITLSMTRDTLLPKLMSGELHVA